MVVGDGDQSEAVEAIGVLCEHDRDSTRDIASRRLGLSRGEVEMRLDGIDGEVDIGDNLPWDDPDPLRTTLLSLFDTAPSSGAVDGHELSTVLDSALRVWLARPLHRPVSSGGTWSV